MSAPIISPSILAADFSRLGHQISAISNADWIHVDIMDGHFVPNLSFGPGITSTVNGLTDQHLDVHLMIEHPEKWAQTYIEAGADCVIFHVEAMESEAAVVELARDLRSQGVMAGISIKPKTPVEPWLEILEEIDLVLVMSVEPGFGGQKFMPEMLDKARALRAAIDERGLKTLIEIDGGIDATTITQAAAAGVDAFVAGSAVFKHADSGRAVDELRSAATQATAS